MKKNLSLTILAGAALLASCGGNQPQTTTSEASSAAATTSAPATTSVPEVSSQPAQTSSAVIDSSEAESIEESIQEITSQDEASSEAIVSSEEQSIPEETSSLSDKEVTVVDGVGRSVTVVPANLKRVVCIGAGALRLYSYIGDMSLLCGVEDVDHPDRTTMWKTVARPYYMANMDLLKTLPSCGKGGPANQSAEPLEILKCEPDVIISEYEDVKAANDLSNEVGVPVVVMKMGKKACFDETLRNTFTTLGKVFGKEDRAKALNDYLISIEEDINNRTKDIKEEDKPTVYLAGLGNWGQKGLFDTVSNYPLFNAAHIKNIVDGKDIVNGQGAIQEAHFVAWAEDMDKMIVDASGLANIKKLYKEKDYIFDGNKAVNNGEVYLQMAYNAYYTNIEIALMDAYFDGASVYPDAFKDIDLATKCDEITTMMNGKALYNDIKAMDSSFGGFQKIENFKEFLSK